MALGLAILSAIVVLFFVKPLTTDGMTREDEEVCEFLSTKNFRFRDFAVPSLLEGPWLWHIDYGFHGQCYIINERERRIVWEGLMGADLDYVYAKIHAFMTLHEQLAPFFIFIIIELWLVYWTLDPKTLSRLCIAAIVQDKVSQESWQMHHDCVSPEASFVCLIFSSSLLKTDR